ncbi:MULTISPECIES: NUDIX domain-containing protein [Bizionia]|uniref:GDP-mannose pyrophosphatase n=1 Tax=Bizionia algoritergicola TaxID=291187 RepID=A0A5D0QVT7_9FLAO|nr:MULTISPECIES: NUDIX domain-containing protein [Bizionia]OBX22185.1 ADP-ribose pyrophosphatase [Bizionia sp. APA-3]TYB73242.1 NUDIX domain-containing protein [Bizionia algoritergicola]
MKYRLLHERLVFDHVFQIKKARIKHDLFNSGSIEEDRFCFERGDSVAIVLYEKDTDSLLFTKQFRYLTIKERAGWILELTAGSIETHEEPEHRVKMEVEEEIGYKLNGLDFISSFFVSPVGSSERIFLYYAEVNSSDKVFKGGGMTTEKEAIQLVKMPVIEVHKHVKNNQFRDAKTIIGIQWFLGHTMYGNKAFQAL